MPITRATDPAIWELPGTQFRSLASPSRGGSAEVSVWRLVIDPGTEGPEHRLTGGEVFAPVAGAAEIRIAGNVATIGVGDALVVPAHTNFSVSNHAGVAFEAIVCLPAGSQAVIGDAEPFTPEWAS